MYVGKLILSVEWQILYLQFFQQNVLNTQFFKMLLEYLFRYKIKYCRQMHMLYRVVQKNGTRLMTP